MNIIIQIAIKIIMMIIIMQLTKTKAPPAGTIADVTQPDVSESAAIGFGYGSYENAGNVIWQDDFDTNPIEVDGGPFAPDVTVGYEYFLGLLFALNHGIGTLQKIIVQEKEAWVNENGLSGNFSSNFKIDLGNDNGMSGDFDFYEGNDNQPVNPYVSQFADIPAYNGMMQVIYKKCYVGNSTTLPVTKFVCSSTGGNHAFFDQNKIIIDKMTEYYDAELGGDIVPSTILNSNKSVVVMSSDGSIVYDNGDNYTVSGTKININSTQSGANQISEGQTLKIEFHCRLYDLNPAVIIYDILVNETYGTSTQPERIDEQSFIDAANVLYDENFGLSMYYAQGNNGEEFISQILKHISAVKTEDATTGLIKLKLIRDDYDVETIPELTVQTLDKFDRTASEDLFSEVKIEYVNKSNTFNKSLAIFQNTGLTIEKATANQSTTMQFHFCTTEELASKIAYREAIPVTSSLLQVELTCQALPDLENGDVVKFSWSPLGIENMVLRIQAVDKGTFGDNKMKITAIQDTFGVQFTTYSEPGRNKAKPIDFSAKPMALNVIETPYFMSNNTSKILGFGDKPTNSTLRYELLINDTNAGSSKAFTPIGTLDGSISFDDTTVNILSDKFDLLMDYNQTQLENGYNLALITDGVNQEFINFEYTSEVAGDKILNNVKRGCLDTKPKEWTNGSNIYFISYGNAISTIELSTNQVLAIQALTVTDREKLSKADAPIVNYTTDAEKRFERPIIAAEMRANGNIIYDQGTIPADDELTLDWEYRNIANQNIVKSYLDGAELGNDGTTYHIIIKDQFDVVILDTTTTDKTYTFTETPGAFEPELRVTVISEKNGNTSFDSHQFTVTRV